MPLDPEEFKEIQSEFKSTLTDLLKERDDKTTDLSEQIDHLKTKSEAEQTDIKGRIDETKSEVDKISETIEKFERKMAKLVHQEQDNSTPGQQLIASDEFKSVVTTDKPMSFSMDIKDITNLGNVTTGVSRNVLVPEHQGGFIQPAEISLRVRSLIPTGQTTSNSVRYYQESGYTNNAGMVPEGGTKPQSEITFSEQTVPVQKIAHKFRLSMEVLDDAPMLRSYIDGRGRYGLNLKEEDQLLRGNGTGVNLKGIIPNSTAFNPATISGYTPATTVDELRVAKLQVRKALYPASGIVINPETWAEIELLKDADDKYLFSMVTTGATPRLWGLPVVQSDGIEPGDFVCGAFSLGTQIWDRMGMRVMLSTEDGNNFSENMVTILFEKRLALEITRPEVLIYKNAA